MKLNPTLRDILLSCRCGEVTVDEAAHEIEGLRIENLAGIACIDAGRSVRCGLPEVVLAEGKDSDKLTRIMCRHLDVTGRCIATRVTGEQAAAVKAEISGSGVTAAYHRDARVLILSHGEPPERTGGRVGILTAGTVDIPVAEEARIIAEETGCEVHTAYDVGVAGIHRLFTALREMPDVHAYVVAAGREGTLPAIVAGLTDRPVIGVPVSSGYGYMGRGEAALAGMLQSCSVLAVVNIDAGFVAGAFAAQIANMVARHVTTVSGCDSVPPQGGTHVTSDDSVGDSVPPREV